MSWGSERRAFIIVLIGLVITAFVAWVAIATFFKAPTCFDRTQNQDEEGVDCGGSCTYLCTALLASPVPDVAFVRPLTLSNGRTDVIAYLVNKNPNALLKDAHYVIELFNAKQTLVATKEGTVTLPASSEVPLFVPNFSSGESDVAYAFVTFATTSLEWIRSAPLAPSISVANTSITGSSTPKIVATLKNTTASSLRNTKVIATLFDASGKAIAASQTVVSFLAGFGEAQAVFTWNEPFESEPVRIDIRPIQTVP